MQRYGLPTASSSLYTDADSDRMNNWQEWVSGTDPTNASSVLQLMAPLAGPSGTKLTWSSVNNRLYDVERSVDLGAPAGFAPLATNIAGLAGATSYTDTNSTAEGRANYRVRVRQ